MQVCLKKHECPELPVAPSYRALTKDEKRNLQKEYQRKMKIFKTQLEPINFLEIFPNYVEGPRPNAVLGKCMTNFITCSKLDLYISVSEDYDIVMAACIRDLWPRIHKNISKHNQENPGEQFVKGTIDGEILAFDGAGYLMFC